MPVTHEGSTGGTLGGKWAVILFILVLSAFVVESQFTQVCMIDGLNVASY